MGLNAIVYCNIKNVAMDNNICNAAVDDYTGEVFFEDLALSRKYPGEMFVAKDKRLGNVEEVACLRELISRNVSEGSILLKNVLYSGSHSGDIIDLNSLDALEEEVAHVKALINSDMYPMLKTFLDSMSELINSAKDQRNPIVFT